MTVRTVTRRWLGPALTASLWIGIAAAPGPGLTAAEIWAIWGHAPLQADQASRTQPRQAQAPHDQPYALPDRPEAASPDHSE